ncbi:transcription factor PCL1-like [Olea europaea var. sylvestris]|uniref:transcription factor PCL1-like n=1 Tax=Olea europaea var. sylvestris TaxID=158386 RepID=UPI000C1CCF87|nr:transcription factor PCL1-like [Olea europaea var. sylvestris]XP_022874876.1 transcription factor PCL1-like [Olea europaea var. sylvestris]XP_022874878.1 transcription factor PCL1-like [Olea europaea var. sylvestris]XP_022874879.1 transcription factor PCL1-like [Olea europaea var. sylvestris]XP_022874880.1 transcription factor PCL1-like [Olea europaea var. sylvestris]XP_022874881.1 transcription factor PCL1-like [Olea europaea var. sylvestris]
MGDEVKIDGGEDRVTEWEAGLPTVDDLTPLSQALIPPELASAFKISPEPTRTFIDVNRASKNTISSLCGRVSQPSSNFKPFLNNQNHQSEPSAQNHMMEETEMDDPDPTQEGSDPKKFRRMEPEEVDSVTQTAATDNGTDDQSAAAKTLKRPRLVWTPQLHKRFVDVVAHLGLKNAVPKTIMQLMNVEGLTRENVASHLQKYRLYVKRMQGLSNEGPSASDHLFASTPVPPQSFNDSSSCSGHGNLAANGNRGGGNRENHVGMPIPMPYPPPQQLMPMPMMVMAAHGHVGMQGNMNSPAGINGYEAHSHHSHYPQQYSSMMQQQRDWSGNKYNGYLHHANPNDK